MDPDLQWKAVKSLAAWSPWRPFDRVREEAPRLPGVYLFRDQRTAEIVYVGMAGERAGSGRPQGLWGRLGVYRIGKGAMSGFGEAVFDRALNDEAFLSRQLDRVRSGEGLRSKDWAVEAIKWWAPEVCWAECESRVEALALEGRVLLALEGSKLWNRGPSRQRRTGNTAV